MKSYFSAFSMFRRNFILLFKRFLDHFLIKPKKKEGLNEDISLIKDSESSNYSGAYLLKKSV